MGRLGTTGRQTLCDNAKLRTVYCKNARPPHRLDFCSLDPIARPYPSMLHRRLRNDRDD
jgi:hypothetical protein